MFDSAHSSTVNVDEITTVPEFPSLSELSLSDVPVEGDELVLLIQYTDDRMSKAMTHEKSRLTEAITSTLAIWQGAARTVPHLQNVMASRRA